MKKFWIYILTAVVAAITTVFALETVKVSATEVTVTTVADLVRELKELPQEEGASVSFSTRGMHITYRYEFVAEDEMRAMMAAAEILYPDEYAAIMDTLAEQGLDVSALCGWQLRQTTITTYGTGWVV